MISPIITLLQNQADILIQGWGMPTERLKDSVSIYCSEQSVNGDCIYMYMTFLEVLCVHNAVPFLSRWESN